MDNSYEHDLTHLLHQLSDMPSPEPLHSIHMLLTEINIANSQLILKEQKNSHPITGLQYLEIRVSTSVKKQSKEDIK